MPAGRMDRAEPRRGRRRSEDSAAQPSGRSGGRPPSPGAVQPEPRRLLGPLSSLPQRPVPHRSCRIFWLASLSLLPPSLPLGVSAPRAPGQLLSPQLKRDSDLDSPQRLGWFPPGLGFSAHPGHRVVTGWHHDALPPPHAPPHVPDLTPPKSTSSRSPSPGPAPPASPLRPRSSRAGARVSSCDRVKAWGSQVLVTISPFPVINISSFSAKKYTRVINEIRPQEMYGRWW